MEFRSLKPSLNSHSCPNREKTHTCRLHFHHPVWGEEEVVEHISTKPSNPQSSYFLLLFSLPLLIWICFKLLRNLLLLVMSLLCINHLSWWALQHTSHHLSPSSQHLDKDLQGSSNSRHAYWCHWTLPAFSFQVLPEARMGNIIPNSKLHIVFLQQVGTNHLTGTW